MQRRHFLQLALKLSVAGGALVAGCGGNGGGGGGAAVSRVVGRVVLPPGATVAVQMVMNALGGSTMRTDGSFDFAASADTPLLSSAHGPGGGAVLYGFLQKSGDTLSAHSTAFVMAYAALGVGAFAQEIQNLYLTAIAASTRLGDLESAVAAAVIARGEGWLDEMDATLVAALTAVQAELSAQAFGTRGVILDKTDRVSGLQVNADGIGSLNVTNYYRRRSYVYVDRVSYKVKGTNDVVDFKGPISPQPLKIFPVKGVSNTLANLGALFGGQRDFYEPVTYGPVSIPVDPTEAASTTYTATAVGVGVSPGDFGKLTSVQQDGWWEVTVMSLVVDIIAPVIAGVVIPNLNKDINNYVGFMGAGGVLKDITNAIAASPDIRNKAQSGKLGDAAWDTLLLIVKTDTLKNVFLQVTGDFLESAFGVASSNLVSIDRAKFVAESGMKLLSFISKINVGLQVFDSVTTAFQLGNCNSADVFTLEVTNGIAKLNPDHALANRIQAAIPFTATVTNADVSSDTILSYQWSSACQFGDISDGIHTNNTDGKTFDSSSNILSYVPNGKAGAGDVEVVSVKIFKGPINKRIAIGTAVAPVTFVAVEVTGSATQLKPNATATLSAEVKGLPALKAGEAIEFRWTTTRNAGELLGSPDGGAVTPVIGSKATYRASAAQVGTDLVTVEAFLGSVRLGTATLSVVVGGGGCRGRGC